MEYNMKTAIAQMQNGEEAGMNYIYSKTYNYVYLRAKSILNRESDIQQLMKATYLKMFEEAARIEEEEVYEWLGKNVYKIGSNYYRKKTIRESECLEFEPEELTTGKIPNMDVAVASVVKKLSQMPDMYQSTAYAFYYDYMPIAEIAEIMNCSIGVVISRLNYTRKFINKVLEDVSEEKGLKMSFHVAFVRNALRQWSLENCLGVTIAQAVYGEICREIGIQAEAIQVEGKEFAGVNNTVVYYRADDWGPIQSEIDLYSKKTSGNKKVLGVVVGIAVVAMVVFFAIILFGKTDEKEPKEDKTSPKVEEQQKEQQEKEKPAKKEEKKEEKQSDESEYIFPHSATKELTREEVEKLSKEELRLARNEIFARHGMIFGVDDLKEYFSAKSWYNPRIPGDEFSESVEMSIIEEKNVSLILEVEESK